MGAYHKIRTTKRRLDNFKAKQKNGLSSIIKIIQLIRVCVNNNENEGLGSTIGFKLKFDSGFDPILNIWSYTN